MDFYKNINYQKRLKMIENLRPPAIKKIESKFYLPFKKLLDQSKLSKNR